MSGAGKNLNLSKAKSEKNDEYFTRIEDIEAELSHYTEFIHGKRILCNCNDIPGTSFFDYFVSKFNETGIQSVTGVGYSEHGNGMKYVFDGNSIISSTLSGSGGFETNEGIGLIHDCDLVITNPPFSRLTEYIDTLVTEGARFIIVGNINAATNKIILDYIKDGKIWLGSGYNHLSMWFGIPENYQKCGKSLYVDESGKRFWKVCGTVWYTNINSDFRHREIDLRCSVNNTKYEKFDNIDAINVTRYDKIPYDYDGLIGVPISFLDKYCPEQFEIVGNEDTFGLYKGRCYLNGKRMYSRIFIRRK